MSKNHDAINSPEWYTKGGIEAIDYINAKELNFNIGNVIKYVTRAGIKHENRLEDLKKAQFYLAYEIERITKNENSEKKNESGDWAI